MPALTIDGTSIFYPDIHRFDELGFELDLTFHFIHPKYHEQTFLLAQLFHEGVTVQ